MNIKGTVSALVVAGSLHHSAVAADTYNIDPMHTTVGFAVSHLVINTVHGKFNEFEGTVAVDEGQISAAQGIIQAKSINTGIDKRDNHLRSGDFFDVEKFPKISFQSKRVEKRGDESILVADFTMHGVTKELQLPAVLKGPIKDPWGNQRIGLQARAKLNRKDYGLKYNQALETGGLVVGDEVEIEINAEAVKQPAK